MFHQLEEDLFEFEDEADWWDNFAKPAIICFLKSFSVSLAKQNKCLKTFLLSLLRLATRKEQWKLVSETKEKLEAIVKHEAFGLIVHSRDNQNTEEEAASIYHYNKSCGGNFENLCRSAGAYHSQTLSKWLQI